MCPVLDTTAPPELETATVVDDTTGRSFETRPGQIVLDASFASGEPLPHGCRVGACGACAVEVVEGLAACDPPDAIERDALRRYHLPPNIRLSCRLTCHGALRVRPL